VDDFAAGPDGTTIIAAQFIYAPRLVKGVVLTYDSTGTLRTIFHPEPYSAEAITVDDSGNLYLLGEKIDEREGDPSYPLLIKYDPTGNVLSRAVYSNLFKDGSDAIQSFGRAEELASATVALQNGNLYIFAPNAKEVLVCSLDGTILRRVKLENVLQGIARADRVYRAAIAEVAFIDPNHLVVYVTEHAKTEDSRVINVGNVSAAAYLVDLTTMKFKLKLRGTSGAIPTFLGVKGNQLLTLTRSQQRLDIQTHDLF
jgi:hypothetical protein